MKLLKLLNNKNFFLISILFLSFFTQLSFADNSVDIWNIENSDQKKEINTQNNTTEENLNSIYKTNSQKKITNIISEERDITAKEINIVGIYDPSDNDLSINMWSYSDGKKILELIRKIKKINLSKDANEILEIILLTNTYYPQKNITKAEFLNSKSDWLIEHNDLELIKNYLLMNKNLKNKSDLFFKFLFINK